MHPTWPYHHIRLSSMLLCNDFLIYLSHIFLNHISFLNSSWIIQVIHLYHSYFLCQDLQKLKCHIHESELKQTLSDANFITQCRFHALIAFEFSPVTRALIENWKSCFRHRSTAILFYFYCGFRIGSSVCWFQIKMSTLSDPPASHSGTYAMPHTKHIFI